jgi:hypothetical protein
MVEVLTEKGLNLSVKNGLLAVSPKTRLTDDLREFIRHNKEAIILELQTQNLESLLLSDQELREQFDFEVEERTAILIFDANTLEGEAAELARSFTFQTWLGLFTEV